jgi:hypothetical protein
VTAALKHVGLVGGAGRYREPLEPAWAELLAKLDNKKRFGVLRRNPAGSVGRFGTGRGFQSADTPGIDTTQARVDGLAFRWPTVPQAALMPESFTHNEAPEVPLFAKSRLFN